MKLAVVSRMGTLISAILASACCILPLVLVALGAGGLGFASALEAYRPLLMAVTFTLLGTAFYFTYRKKGSCATEAETCSTESMKTGRAGKISLWIVTLFAVGFLLFPYFVGSFAGGGDDPSDREHLRTVVLGIEGMTCEACAVTLRAVLNMVDGVQTVNVSLDKKLATIGIRNGADAGLVTKLVEAVNATGKYKASVVSKDGSP